MYICMYTVCSIAKGIRNIPLTRSSEVPNSFHWDPKDGRKLHSSKKLAFLD